MRVQDEPVGGGAGLGSGDKLFANMAPGLGWETECTLRGLAIEKGFRVVHL